MTAPVNGTDERLDVVIELLREILAELRHGRACDDAPAPDAKTQKRTRKGP